MEIIETFSVTTKMVKFSNITRNIFILDLNDFTCIRIIRRFVWERWQTCLCFCHGALYSVIIEVLHIALNLDSYQWPERIHKKNCFSKPLIKIKKKHKRSVKNYLFSNIRLDFFRRYFVKLKIVIPSLFYDKFEYLMKNHLHLLL